MASDVDPAADLLMPGLSGLLDDIDQAVIVHDASGRIQLLNMAARRLFPDLDLGDEFAGSGESFVIEAGRRRVSGRPRRLAAGCQAWVLSDIGPGPGGLDAPALADQQGFMLQASRELAAGVSHEAAVSALVRLAVPAVGEQAVLLCRYRGPGCPGGVVTTVRPRRLTAWPGRRPPQWPRCWPARCGAPPRRPPPCPPTS